MKNPKSVEQESNVDFYKNIAKSLISKWYYFVISLLITVSLGHYIYKSSSPMFRNNLVMLLAEERSNRQNSGELMQFEMFDTQSNIEDEIGIIQSFPIINQTIKSLDLVVSYYMGEGLFIKDIYRKSPFVVLADPQISQPADLYFKVEMLSKDKFRVSAKSDNEIYMYNLANNDVTGSFIGVDFSQDFSIGDEIVFKDSRFKILLNGNYSTDVLVDQVYYFKFNNIELLTYEYQGALSIERTSSQSSIANLEVRVGNARLATDFLNKLTEVYLGENLAAKNAIASKTIAFIDKQIAGIADSLSLTANNLESFRTKNKVMDINFLSQNVYTQMTQLQDQKAELMVKSKYYDYIKEYFESNEDLNDMLAPSSMGVDDPQLINLINQLTDLNAQRSLYLANKSFKNPAIPALNAQITNVKKTIRENIDYLVNTSTITTNDIDDRIRSLSRQISKLPTTEKELINIRRAFDINDAIYTFLLQKRSEAEIARASNKPDYNVISPSRLSSATQISPKKQMIYFSAFFLGLMIPVGMVFMMSAVNETIPDKNDIAKLTDLPIVGTIAKNDNKSMMPVSDFPKSLISETFRSLRTSLQFFHENMDKQKLLITSSYSGDGKTFIAINTAIVYSYFGKKTLLIEFDMRNPKIANYLNIDNKKGLSSYLVNDAKLEDIIQSSTVKNMDIITAGELPPNPVELIASENTKNLMEVLTSIYDYIIIDSPPIGVVTDSFLLMGYADINIFPVRLNYTNKKLFTSLMQDIEQKGIKNFAILANDDNNLAKSTYYTDSNKSFLRKRLITFAKLIGLKK